MRFWVFLPPLVPSVGPESIRDGERCGYGAFVRAAEHPWQVEQELKVTQRLENEVRDVSKICEICRLVRVWWLMVKWNT